MPTFYVSLFLVLAAFGLFLLTVGRDWRATRFAILPLAGAAAVLVRMLLPYAPGGLENGTILVAGLIALWSAVRVITHKNPVYAALYFILIILSVAALLVLLQTTFVAMALVIIYAGAILVTYVFVIMLAQQPGVAPYDAQPRSPVLGIVFGFILLTVLTTRVFENAGDATAPQRATLASAPTTAVELGAVLMSQYVIGLQIAGLLLTAAMVGAIAIAQRKVVVGDAAAEMDD